ncbi:hypothetical protein Q9L58_007399 [Maublancomyces gigas]|uniref:C2H2-type domain-containing protein n=1 Tax=Discina gigas TaxID=1032678 RepID=A0ABR3GCW6_9PEZI
MADPSTVPFAEKVFALSKVIHTVEFWNEIAAPIPTTSRNISAYSMTSRSSLLLSPRPMSQQLPSSVVKRNQGFGYLSSENPSVISKTSGMKYVHDQKEEVHQYFKQRLGDWYRIRGRFFMSNLVSLEVGGCVGDQLSLLIELAHITGSFNPVTAVFPDLELAKRIRLLGDYFGAVTRIVKFFDTIRPTPPVKITFIEQTSFPADFLLVMNQYAAEKRLPQVDYPALTRACPRHTPFVIGGKPDQFKTQCVYAECTLAVYLTKLGHSWEHIEIGCSKGSCWLCEMYFTNYCSVLKFHVSNVHGKLLPGWTIPAGGDQGSKEHIPALIDDGTQEVLHRAHNSKKSDSEPRSGRESNGENGVSASV